MKYLLPLVILIYNCLMIQGVLEWTVVGKVTEYGQNVTLFCNVPNCCPKDAGWDRWTPEQRTLFIDVKTGRPNKKYDGKVEKDGYTLIIQNLTKNDLNVSYSCLYGVTFGESKYLLEEDVFTFISSTQPNVTSGLSQGELAALITGVIVLVSVSVTISICFGRRLRKKRNDTNENKIVEYKVRDGKKLEPAEVNPLIKKEEHSNLKEKIKKIETEQKKVIPKNITDQIQRQIKDWEEKDKMFVSTRASDYVMECLQDNSCLTLTAPSGVGKSFIARHTALLLKKEGYNIIPVYSPTDIRDYYQPGKQTVFIVDDICGNFSANQQQIDNWKQLLPVINTIIADKCCKIIVSCRLQVYKDEKFNILSPFKSCECNLISDKLCLTSVEKTNIANTYIGTSMKDIHDLSQNCDFFPLLCSLYHEKKDVDVKEFFKNPFAVYKNELDRLSEHGDEEKYKICSLALCVLFNNHLDEKWFLGKVTKRQKQIIKDTYNACGLDRGISKVKLQHALDTLVGTFICKQIGIYRTIHDKVFDFLAHYFGQKMIECLIDHGDSGLVHERFIWQKLPGDMASNIDFIIEIPDDYLESYLERFIKDWSAGKVADVFSNNNIKDSSFRQKLLQYLKQLHKPQQVTLANTKDTVIPKENCASGTTPLVWNCYDGYTDVVQWLLCNDVDVNQCRDDGVTGLIMASHEGHTDIVKLLLEKGPNVDLCNKNGCSPLYKASQNGHTDIVKLLLERNPNVDLCNNEDCSPLLLASQEGHTDVVKLLLERNPNVDLCNKDGCSPLNMASQEGHTDVVKLLLERNPKVDLCNNEDCSPLYMASHNGHTDIVKLLLERNPNVDLCNNDDCSPLYIASQNGHTDILKLLLERNPNVDLCNNEDCSPLYMASHNGHTDIVKLLLERNPNVDLCNKNGCSPLYKASQEGHTDIVKLLLERNPNVDLCYNEDCSPLLLASQEGHTDVVKLLLERNPNVDLCNKDGCSPLNMASQEGHTDVVKLLLERNPNVDLCNKDDCSPLYIASQNGNTDIVKLLLERNPNVDLCNNEDCSPLNMASQEGHTNVVKLLLERNPNVDLCNKNDISPLCKASNNGNTDIVKLLLERNPNVDLCDNDGCSPLYWASQNGHTDIVKLLLERNPNPNVDLCDNNGVTPLISSCIHNHTSIVQLLVKHKPNINTKTMFGNSAIYYSVQNGRIDITKLLLENNADCNICIHSKQDLTDTFTNHPKYTLDQVKQELFNNLVMYTPSHVAAYIRKNSVEYAFDVVAGSSPLHIACFKGSIDVVRCLLNHNANINMTKEDGTTPLFYACEVGHEDIVRLLLDKGADTQICRLDGKSPLQISTDNGHTSIVMILTNHTKKEDKVSS
ncbi:ankyrin-1-like isoform X3 [Mytilus californianus]|uniref:ankyrin-1-like isoform X3 n=1 Tax=Mytilus californianus TaxID=6549 RepID=UPI0022468D89|nr:ankyrin-1-like isoform X3 [Mytilus californianus]